MNPNEIQAVMLLSKGTRIKDKPFVRVNGKELFLYGYEILTELFENVLIVCRNDIFDRLIRFSKGKLKLRNSENFGLKKYKIENLISENRRIGPIGAIYEGAKNSNSEYIFVAGCDMPFLNKGVIKFLCNSVEMDCVVPRHEDGKIEPLHSIYRRERVIDIIDAIGDKKNFADPKNSNGIFGPIEPEAQSGGKIFVPNKKNFLSGNFCAQSEICSDSGEKRISKIIEMMDVRFISTEKLKVYDRELLTFKNINTYEDIAWMKDYL